MLPDFKNTVLNRHGYTDDICRDLTDTYEKFRDKCGKFAEQFRRDTLDETCRALFDFVVENFRYREDPLGVQMIKTPARLMYQKVGDCKSFTLFVNCMLWNLGYKPWFRFVSYGKDSEYQHVYTVVDDDYGCSVTVDAVAYIQKKIPYGTEMKYYEKMDMQSTKIIRMSGIGTTAEDFVNSKLKELAIDPDAVAKEINGLQLKNGATVTDAKTDKKGNILAKLSDGSYSEVPYSAYMSIAQQASGMINNIEIREWSQKENPILGQLQEYLLSNASTRNASVRARYQALAELQKPNYLPVIIAGCFVLVLVYLKSQNKTNVKVKYKRK